MMPILYKYKKEIEKKELDYENDIQTPIWLVKEMVKMIPRGTKTVLDPTPGNGNIVKECKLSKFKIESVEDIFKIRNGFRVDCVVMNPPFSKKNLFMKTYNSKVDSLKESHVGYYILEVCMGISDNIICIMPWYYIINSVKRTEKLKKYGLLKIVNLPRKTFKAIRVQTCLVVLVRGYKSHTIFENMVI